MKKVIALLLTLMMILSLAACAVAPAKETNSETTAPAAQENTTETDVPNDVAPGAEYEGKSIQIMFNSDDTWNDVIDNYAKAAIAEAFPGLNVEFVPLQDVPVETLATVGELPDIWFGTVSTAQIEAGICLDLKPYLTDWFTENFNNPNFYNDSKGRVWAVGSGTDTFYTSVYYYNKDVFAACGLEAPKNFDDLLNTCQILLDNGYDIPLSHSGWTTSVYWLEQAIVCYDPEAYADLMANKTDFNDPRIRAAIANIQQLVDMGALGIGTVEKDATASISEFVEGKAPIMSTMSWNSGAIAGQTDFEVGQFFLPSANEAYPSGAAYTCWGSFLNGWSVSASTEDPELTVAVLKTLIEQEAKRNFDNGLVTNYKVDGEIAFVNDLDADRYEMFKNVTTWGSAFYPNALDANSQTEYFSVINEWLMDDSDMTADDVCDAMQAIWEQNTFFEVF